MSGTAKLVTELVGTRLGDRYVLEEKIGAGGFAVVYRSRDTRIHKQVAIKVLDRAKIQSLRDIARFRNEAAIAAAIDDPHVIKITDYGEEGTIFYYVMELLRGHTLRSIITMHDRLHWQRACDICEQVLLALELAHEHTIIHRDVKPENIFIEFRRGSENVKLLDLGIAKVLHEWDGLVGNLSSTGDFIGSPAYMAPEQAKGTKHCDFRVDLYAVGVVLYELITGGVPYRGGSAWETMLLHVEGVFPGIHERAPGVECPAELEQIVARALNKDSSQRFQTAAEMGDALRQVRQSRPAIPWEPLWTPPTGADNSQPMRGAGDGVYAKTTPAEHRRAGPDAQGTAIASGPPVPDVAPQSPRRHAEPARAPETVPALTTSAPQLPLHFAGHGLPLRWRTRFLLAYLTLGSLVATCATSTLATVSLHPDLFTANYNHSSTRSSAQNRAPEFEDEEPVAVAAAASVPPTPADLLFAEAAEAAKPEPVAEAEADSLDGLLLAPPTEPEPEPTPEPVVAAATNTATKEPKRPDKPTSAIKKPTPVIKKSGAGDDDPAKKPRRLTMATCARRAATVIEEACQITPFSPLKEAKYTVLFKINPTTGAILGVSSAGDNPPLRMPDCVVGRARALVKDFANASDLKSEYRYSYVVVR